MDNGCVPLKQKALIWIYADLVHGRNHVSFGLIEWIQDNKLSQRWLFPRLLCLCSSLVFSLTYIVTVEIMKTYFVVWLRNLYFRLLPTTPFGHLTVTNNVFCPLPTTFSLNKVSVTDKSREIACPLPQHQAELPTTPLKIAGRFL